MVSGMDTREVSVPRLLIWQAAPAGRPPRDSHLIGGPDARLEVMQRELLAAADSAERFGRARRVFHGAGKPATLTFGGLPDDDALRSLRRGERDLVPLVDVERALGWRFLWRTTLSIEVATELDQWSTTRGDASTLRIRIGVGAVREIAPALGSYVFPSFGGTAFAEDVGLAADWLGVE